MVGQNRDVDLHSASDAVSRADPMFVVLWHASLRHSSIVEKYIRAE